MLPSRVVCVCFSFLCLVWLPPTTLLTFTVWVFFLSYPAFRHLWRVIYSNNKYPCANLVYHCFSYYIIHSFIHPINHSFIQVMFFNFLLMPGPVYSLTTAVKKPSRMPALRPFLEINKSQCHPTFLLLEGLCLSGWGGEVKPGKEISK